jgi:hypothetical protein
MIQKSFKASITTVIAVSTEMIMDLMKNNLGKNLS